MTPTDFHPLTSIYFHHVSLLPNHTPQAAAMAEVAAEQQSPPEGLAQVGFRNFTRQNGNFADTI